MKMGQQCSRRCRPHVVIVVERRAKQSSCASVALGGLSRLVATYQHWCAALSERKLFSRSRRTVCPPNQPSPLEQHPGIANTFLSTQIGSFDITRLSRMPQRNLHTESPDSPLPRLHTNTHMPLPEPPNHIPRPLPIRSPSRNLLLRLIGRDARRQPPRRLHPHTAHLTQSQLLQY